MKRKRSKRRKPVHRFGHFKVPRRYRVVKFEVKGRDVSDSVEEYKPIVHLCVNARSKTR